MFNTALQNPKKDTYPVMSSPFLLEGELQKKGLFTKLKRYYVLRDSYLCYYNTKSDYIRDPNKPKGTYMLHECQFQLNMAKREPFGLKIIKGNKDRGEGSLKLSQILFETFETATLWVKAIHHNKGLLNGTTRRVSPNRCRETPKVSQIPIKPSLEKRNFVITPKSEVNLEASSVRMKGLRVFGKTVQGINVIKTTAQPKSLQDYQPTPVPVQKTQEGSEKPRTGNLASYSLFNKTNNKEVNQNRVAGPSYQSKKEPSASLNTSAHEDAKQGKDKENKLTESIGHSGNSLLVPFKKPRSRFYSISDNLQSTSLIKQHLEDQKKTSKDRTKGKLTLKDDETLQDDLSKSLRSNSGIKFEGMFRSTRNSRATFGESGRTSRKVSDNRFDTRESSEGRTIFKKFRLTAILPQTSLNASEQRQRPLTAVSPLSQNSTLRNLPRGSVNLNLSFQVKDRDSLSTFHGSMDSPLERFETFSPLVLTSNSKSPAWKNRDKPLFDKPQLVDLNADNLTIPDEEEEDEGGQEIIGLKDLNFSLIERTPVSRRSQSPSRALELFKKNS